MLSLFLKSEVNVVIIPKGRSKCCNYSEVNVKLFLKAEVKVIIIPEVRSKCYNYS